MDWYDSLMILLPRIKHPKLPWDTRPIVVGSAAEKILSRVVLERTRSQLQLQQPCQCSGLHRQSADYIFSVHRLMELEKEWGRGVSILKEDFPEPLTRWTETSSSAGSGKRWGIPRNSASLNECSRAREAHGVNPRFRLPLEHAGEQ